MHIILATPLFPPEIGGPATYVKEIAERLRSAHRITIVAYASTAEHIDGVRLITVSKRKPLPIRLLKYTWVLFQAAKDADVLYVQNAVASGLPAVIVGKLRRIPVVIKFVGDEAWERATQLHYTTKQLEDFLALPDSLPIKIRVIAAIQGVVLRNADAVTTPSAYLAEALIRTYRVPRAHMTVNYNAAEKTEVLPFSPEPKKHQAVVTARLVEWKGVAGVLRAIAILVKQFPDVKLLIAGDGPEEENLKKLSHDLGLETHVVFLGRVSRAETWHIRKNSEVYVLNSTYEGLPHTALTSFAAQIPIVATDIPGTNEAVYHEKTGLLVSPGDDAGLAAAIARLFENDALKKELVEGGQKILSEKFSWDTHLSQLLTLLKTVSAKPRN